MYLKHVKGLIWALAVSGFLNVILLTSIFYGMVKERSPTSYCSWPQTSKGQFLFLKHMQGDLEKGVLDAFYISPEFKSVEFLFRGVNPAIENSELLNFLLDGEWQSLAAICEYQLLIGDLSEARRRQILFDYTQNGSLNAALLLVKVDAHFAAKNLADSQVMALLEMLQEKTNENEIFAKAILLSSRQHSIWKMAVSRLYEYAGEKAPEAYSHQEALKRFIPANAAKKITKSVEKPQNVVSKFKEMNYTEKSVELPKAKPLKNITDPHQSDRLYIIQEGDNLWKLSRRFNVDVDRLRSYNKLSSDALVPSSAIRIPNR